MDKKTFAVHLDIWIVEKIKEKVGKGQISAFINQTLKDKLILFDSAYLEQELKKQKDKISDIEFQLDLAKQEEAKEVKKKVVIEAIRNEYKKLILSKPNISYKEYLRKRLKEEGYKVI